MLPRRLRGIERRLRVKARRLQGKKRRLRGKYKRKIMQGETFTGLERHLQGLCY